MNDHHISRLLHEYETGRLSRRQVLSHLGALMALAGGTGLVNGQERDQKSSTFQATGLDHIALRVKDVARSRDFYVKHLGLSVARESPNSAFLDCGNDFVALFRGDQAGMDHYCYAIKNYEVAEAEAKLKAAGIANVRRIGGRIYFSDPDNLTVQVAAGRDRSE
jgi:catechol 2,3-dioxygenase-like lactoylglutathione lyase family enzyme